MSDLTVIRNMEAEKTSLDLHVDLCAERYSQLISKIDEVDNRLDYLTRLCSEIESKLEELKHATQSTHLRWAGVLIMSLAAIVSGLISYIVTVI